MGSERSERGAKHYKEITLEEADMLFRAGCQFECALDAKYHGIAEPTQWSKWEWCNTPPSMYPGDLFRVEVE